MSATLLSIGKEKLELNKAYKIEKNRFDDYTKQYEIQIKELSKKENLLKHSIDLEMFEYGMSIIDLKFPMVRDDWSNERTYKPIYESLILAAKQDIINGFSQLKYQYIGQKYYDGYDQRCDCKYGYGPTHGNVYQSIGLKRPDMDLNDHDAECCLYVLSNIDVALENLNNKTIQN